MSKQNEIHLVGGKPLAIGRRQLVGAAAAGGATLVLGGCLATNPATGRTSYTGGFSIEKEIALGRQEHPKLVKQFGGVYEDRRLQGYVDSVGKELASHAEFQQYPYQFTLLDSSIVNAFALPGGNVYISRGLLALASNEAEMAGVLAHELGHVNARHSAERISSSQLAQIGLTLGAVVGAALGAPSEVMRGALQMGQQLAALTIQSHSRKQEFEADMLGVRYLSRAGYDPDAMGTFLGTLREQSQLEAAAMGLPPGKVDEYNMMSTHPRTIDRVREAQAAADSSVVPNPRIGRDDYLDLIDGMVYGDNPEEGIVYGREFTHAPLRFEFVVPEGYRLQNGAERVVAQAADGSAIIFDIANTGNARDMRDYVGRVWTEGGRVSGLDRLRSAAGEGATAVGQAQTQSGATPVRLAAVRNDANSAFRFVFLPPERGAGAADAAFLDMVRDFRRLSAKEAARIKPLRVRVRRASSKDTVSRLSRRLPHGAQNDEWFRVINDMSPGAELRRNERVKVITT